MIKNITSNCNQKEQGIGMQFNTRRLKSLHKHKKVLIHSFQ
uniref:Uncharacterized protein n=1 Tax=Anguilla anguilla TaxID=7936 RepID=A0A0E9QM84_ANGAN